MRTPIERAILALHPTAQAGIDFELRNDNDARGIYIGAWKLPGDPPSEQDIATLAAQYDAAEAARESEASALRTAVIQLIMGAVGKSIFPSAPNAMTAAERNAVIAGMAFKLGVITAGGNLKDPRDWL